MEKVPKQPVLDLKADRMSTHFLASAVERLLQDHQAYRRMCRPSRVFGDGQSAERIVQILERCLSSSS